MYEIYFNLTLGNFVVCTPTNQHLTFALGYLHGTKKIKLSTLQNDDDC